MSCTRSDLSYMAAFVERHLNFSNWGKVSLLKFGDLVSSFSKTSLSRNLTDASSYRAGVHIPSNTTSLSTTSHPNTQPLSQSSSIPASVANQPHLVVKWLL